MVKVKPIGADGIDGINNGTTMAGIRQTGSIRGGNGFGFIRFGNSTFGAFAGAGGVYQRRVTGYNQFGRNDSLPRRSYYVRMRYYRPTNPNTPAQQANRTKMADAVAGWQALDPVEKRQYNSRALKQSRNGFNLYISEYMKYH